MKATTMICAAALALAAASPALAGKAVVKSASTPMGATTGVGTCAKPGQGGSAETGATKPPPNGGLASHDAWLARCSTVRDGGSGGTDSGGANTAAKTPGVPNMDAGAHDTPK